MIKILIFIIIVVFFNGCDKSMVSKDEVIATNLEKGNFKTEVYNLYIEKQDYTLSKYEPDSNCYTGIYLEGKEGEFIKGFEDFTNTTSNIYLYNLMLGESFPLSWVLKCYSSFKTPFITIYPPDNKTKMFDRETIRNMAKEFGNLQIPMFVNLYPVSKEVYENYSEYISFFKDAKIYFDIYAPNVSFFWSIDQDYVYETKDLYPGDNYVDWVGINIFENIDSENKLNIVLQELDFFYRMYQDKKPIAISNLAISHFASTSYSYNIDDKIREIYRFYKIIPYKYPRIKMINYINYDNFKCKNKNNNNKQNYLITDNKKILKFYEEVVKDEIFSDNFSFTSGNRKFPQKIKTHIIVYSINEKLLIETKKIDLIKTKDINISEIEKINVDNKEYYDLDEVLRLLNLEKRLDKENNNIIIFS